MDSGCNCGFHIRECRSGYVLGNARRITCGRWVLLSGCTLCQSVNWTPALSPENIMELELNVDDFDLTLMLLMGAELKLKQTQMDGSFIVATCRVVKVEVLKADGSPHES